MDAGAVRFFVNMNNVAKLQLADLKIIWWNFYPCATKTICQKSRQGSYCVYMALRKSQLIWVWKYLNLQLLMMTPGFLQKRAKSWKGVHQSFLDPMNYSRCYNM